MWSTQELAESPFVGIAEQRARRARLVRSIPVSAALVFMVGAALTTAAMVQLLGLAG